MRYIIMTPMENIAAGERVECIAETNNLDIVEALFEHNEYVVYDSEENTWMDMTGTIDEPPSHAYVYSLDSCLADHRAVDFNDPDFDFISLDDLSDEWLAIEEKENE